MEKRNILNSQYKIEKVEESWRIGTIILQELYKVTVIKTVWKVTHQWNKREDPEVHQNRHSKIYTDLWQNNKSNTIKQRNIFNICCWKNGHSHGEQKPYTLHKK